MMSEVQTKREGREKRWQEAYQAAALLPDL